MNTTNRLLWAIGPITFGVAALLVMVAPASAENSWVLWWAEGQGSPGSSLAWEPQSGYERMKDCKKNLWAMIMGDTGGELKGGHRSYRCLPDTVDPRGPKAKP